MKNLWERIKEYIKQNKKSLVSSGLIVFGGIMIMSLFVWPQITARFEDKIEEIEYPEFLKLVNEDKVDVIYYNMQDEDMIVCLYNDETKGMNLEDREKYTYENKDKRITAYPGTDCNFREKMLIKGVRLRLITQTGDILGTITSLFSLALFIYIGVFMLTFIKQQSRGLDKSSIIQTSKTSFKDIIGHEEIMEDIEFITDLIKDPTKGDKVGAKIPKGLLLEGPPGCGKTLIARSMAGEAGVPFLYQNASNFIELYVGMGAKRVRELFKFAKKNAPCILFIDEIDAIGKPREHSKNTSENDQTINQLLTEMDGFTGREGVFIIAATNRADSLDSAILRSGRFDRRIVVNPPKDWMVRKELFEHYLAKYKYDKNIDIENLSKQISGFTGADIEMICNEASIRAVMADLPEITANCIEEAIDVKVFKGNRSKKKAQIEDRRIVAYHEAGHAVMSYLLDEPIARASIQSTISGIGGAVFHADKDTLFRTKKDYENKIKIAYAGRASEEIKFEDVTTGASNDITQATQILMEYVESLGFDDEFGLLDIKELGNYHLVEGDIITKKMSEYSTKWYKECLDILKENYDKVECLATKLLEEESLSGDEIYKLFGNK